MVSAGTAALTIGFAVGLNGLPPRVSASETIVPKSLASKSFAPNNFTPDFDAYFGPPADREASAQPQTSDHQKWRLASLETTPVLLPPRVETWIAASTRSRASSAEPPAINLRVASFDERFMGSADDGPGSLQGAQSQEPMGSLLAPAPGSSERGSARRGPAARAPVPLPVSSPLGPAKKQTRVAEAAEDSSTPPSDAADEHTAIYDIAAHKVYLPNGQRLEAHSGLGSRMDDPRYVSEKGRGPTPPNLYELSLREESFHGVRALRLTPVGAGNMFGRDGMLAHTYMLGSNGQSNGCVSFNDYQAFLNAYLSGEITHIAVVDHLANPPSPKTALGWIPEKIKALFGRS